MGFLNKTTKKKLKIHFTVHDDYFTTPTLYYFHTAYRLYNSPRTHNLFWCTLHRCCRHRVHFVSDYSQCWSLHNIPHIPRTELSNFLACLCDKPNVLESSSVIDNFSSSSIRTMFICMSGKYPEVTNGLIQTFVRLLLWFLRKSQGAGSKLFSHYVKRWFRYCLETKELTFTGYQDRRTLR